MVNVSNRKTFFEAGFLPSGSALAAGSSAFGAAGAATEPLAGADDFLGAPMTLGEPKEINSTPRIRPPNRSFIVFSIFIEAFSSPLPFLCSWLWVSLLPAFHLTLLLLLPALTRV